MKYKKRLIEIISWGLIIGFILCLIGLIFSLKPLKSFEPECSKECKKFNWTFYKVEIVYANNIDCYCLNEFEKPQNIGALPKK